MDEIQAKNLLSVNEAVKRGKLENVPISETAIRRWVRDGTLHAVFSGRKALIYWPSLMKLLSGDQT